MTKRIEEALPDGRVRIRVTPDAAFEVHGGAVELDAADYAAYRAWRSSQGGAIQNFLPNLDDAARELLLSGLSPETWAEVFGGGPE